MAVERKKGLGQGAGWRLRSGWQHSVLASGSDKMMAGPILSPEREAGAAGLLQPQVRLDPAKLSAGSDGPSRGRGGSPKLSLRMKGLLGKEEGIGMVSYIPIPTSAHNGWGCNCFQTWQPSLSPSSVSQAVITWGPTWFCKLMMLAMANGESQVAFYFQCKRPSPLPLLAITFWWIPPSQQPASSAIQQTAGLEKYTSPSRSTNQHAFCSSSLADPVDQRVPFRKKHQYHYWVAENSELAPPSPTPTPCPCKGSLAPGPGTQEHQSLAALV